MEARASFTSCTHRRCVSESSTVASVGILCNVLCSYLSLFEVARPDEHGEAALSKILRDLKSDSLVGPSDQGNTLFCIFSPLRCATDTPIRDCDSLERSACPELGNLYHHGSVPSFACENVPVGPSGPSSATRTASGGPSSTVISGWDLSLTNSGMLIEVHSPHRQSGTCTPRVVPVP